MGAIKSVVESAMRNVLAEGCTLHRHLGQVYHEIDRSHLLLQRTTFLQEPNVDNEIQACTSHQDEEGTSDAITTKSDCFAARSASASASTIQQTYKTFNEGASWLFESQSTFRPATYTIATRFNEILTVAATREVGRSGTHRFHKYFLLYAKAPTKRFRITVSAAIQCLPQHSAFLELRSLDVVDSVRKTLPPNLDRVLEVALRGQKMYETVSNVSIVLEEHPSGSVGIDKASVRVTEDVEEARVSRTESFLQDLEDMGCPVYLEKDVIVHSRKTAYLFLVEVYSRLYTERKIPFAGGLPYEGATSNFFNDIKRFCSLRDCPGVARFAGVVLDNRGTRILSYLCEASELGCMSDQLMEANAKGERIPWHIREAWARQLVEAVSTIHAKGIVLGVIWMRDIALDKDGNVVLTSVGTSGRCRWQRKGNLPPELRIGPEHLPSTYGTNFRTDIFQLGQILWLLAEHTMYHGNWIYCRMNACTVQPYYRCTADHTNPVGLPPCRDPEVPQYINVCINFCRQADPTSRLPARDLLPYFPRKTRLPELASRLTRWPAAQEGVIHIHCDECGAPTAHEHYHCNICCCGDFDLCTNCVSSGIHCFVSEHRLERRISRHGSVVVAY